VVREQHVWSQEIFEGETLFVTILRPENDQIRSELGSRLRLHDRFEEVSEPEPAPATVTLGPRRYTMEIRYLFDAAQRMEFRPDTQRGVDVAPDRDPDARGVGGEAKCKLPEPETRKLLALDLAGRQPLDV
jgi:hypothetical protein